MEERQRQPSPPQPQRQPMRPDPIQPAPQTNVGFDHLRQLMSPPTQRLKELATQQLKESG
eukprot:9710662-Karenia_brevis.AAC.1